MFLFVLFQPDAKSPAVGGLGEKELLDIAALKSTRLFPHTVKPAAGKAELELSLDGIKSCLISEDGAGHLEIQSAVFDTI